VVGTQSAMRLSPADHSVWVWSIILNE